MPKSRMRLVRLLRKLSIFMFLAAENQKLDRIIGILGLSTSPNWMPRVDSRITRISGLFLGLRMVVHNDTAILFTGRPAVDVFDLKSETWSLSQTTYSATPADIAAGILGDKLYIFGGTRLQSVHGTRFIDAPMASAQAQWYDFSQLGEPGQDSYLPLHGADEPFGCSDFWSWSVKDEVWRQERTAGNLPCSRTEMVYGYNDKMQKAIIFGNLSTFISRDGREERFPCSYFADTFIYDMELPIAPKIFEPTRSAPKWKQVLTPGFPTYRCQAHPACDPDTGRTLLARTFGDLWELRLDVPGGHFDEVDVEEIASRRLGRGGVSSRAQGRDLGGSVKGASRAVSFLWHLMPAVRTEGTQTDA
ncbi:hypothetical protein B0H13DRAFT_2351282 [Mycena leptocephala]|nr:hypothetical protein B0H13DRAFT_2351282 [Mycena leptocephala]